MVEPTETESKDDARPPRGGVPRRGAEAESDPDMLREAPVTHAGAAARRGASRPHPVVKQQFPEDAEAGAEARLAPPRRPPSAGPRRREHRQDPARACAPAAARRWRSTPACSRRSTGDRAPLHVGAAGAVAGQVPGVRARARAAVRRRAAALAAAAPCCTARASSGRSPSRSRPACSARGPRAGGRRRRAVRPRRRRVRRRARGARRDAGRQRRGRRTSARALCFAERAAPRPAAPRREAGRHRPGADGAGGRWCTARCSSERPPDELAWSRSRPWSASLGRARGWRAPASCWRRRRSGTRRAAAARGRSAQA